MIFEFPLACFGADPDIVRLKQGCLSRSKQFYLKKMWKWLALCMQRRIRRIRGRIADMWVSCLLQGLAEPKPQLADLIWPDLELLILGMHDPVKLLIIHRKTDLVFSVKLRRIKAILWSVREFIIPVQDIPDLLKFGFKSPVLRYFGALWYHRRAFHSKPLQPVQACQNGAHADTDIQVQNYPGILIHCFYKIATLSATARKLSKVRSSLPSAHATIEES